jgi:hypothetical protein
LTCQNTEPDFSMTATAFLDLKQRASKLSEAERRRLSAYLIRLGQERTTSSSRSDSRHRRRK